MPAIISTAHQKGGVGKTTLVLNLYSYLNKQGYNCAIVDADPQGSITDLYDRLGEQEGWKNLQLIKRNSFGSFTDLEGMEDYDVLLVDTPPYLSNTLPEIFEVSDFVLVPCKASPLDALAIQNTLELIEDAVKRKPMLKTAIVMNMAITGTDFNDQVRKILEEHGFPVLKTEIGNRIAYSRSLLLSPSVSSEKNPKATQEIESLIQEIFTILQN